ncbi:flagellar hook-associated protein FlgL [Thiohalobacter sp. IOR34]|uniref:flagellar hook-associated protein FlgL n=1 Tax=Thiohalobacter sp. IOR34 TaxID=3057176 RepID=UPI0025B1F2D1|nr:flagellar hook-associated protein FlgL [Thiohalobacter sp. IOR34]WJW74605.1 flagellar hook-associated protein FlgL [Thiohalobacter sp. IOR34]
MTRLSNLTIFQNGVDAMLEQQRRVFETQTQISSGRRFVSPSDDPTAAAQVVGLSESLSRTEQFQKNIVTATARLELEDTTLDSAVNALQRARELAVRGLSDSMGASGRKDIAREIRQILAEMQGLANTKDANGEYLFAGTKSQVQPVVDAGGGTFTYQGDQGQRLLQVGPSRKIAIGDSGLEVFMKIEDPAGGYKDVFSSLYGLASALESNNPKPASLEELENAIQNLGEVRARIGSRLNAIDAEQQINESFILQLKEMRSSVEDLDITEAASRLNQQMLVLQAAQQAFIRVQGLSLFSLL